MAKKKYVDRYASGDKVKIVGTASRHSIPIGTVVTIHHRYKDMLPVRYYLRRPYLSCWVHETDVVAYTTKIERNHFLKQIKEREKKINSIKERIHYLKENSLEEFDPLEFHCYKVLCGFNDGVSNEEKARKLISIFGFASQLKLFRRL